MVPGGQVWHDIRERQVSAPPPLAIVSTASFLLPLVIYIFFPNTYFSFLFLNKYSSLARTENHTLIKTAKAILCFPFRLTDGGEPQKKHNWVEEDRDADVRKGKRRATIIPSFSCPHFTFFFMSPVKYKSIVGSYYAFHLVSTALKRDQCPKHNSACGVEISSVETPTGWYW